MVEGLIIGPKGMRENHTHFVLSGVEKFHDLLSFPQPGHFPNQPWSGAMTPHCLGIIRSQVRGAPKAPLSMASQSESNWRGELLPPYIFEKGRCMIACLVRAEPGLFGKMTGKGREPRSL